MLNSVASQDNSELEKKDIPQEETELKKLGNF
jgi:hypothetical protein